RTTAQESGMSSTSRGRLTDRIALVTGGGRGIGQAIAERLAAEGAQLVVADIDEPAAASAAQAIAARGQLALSLRIDIASPESVGAVAGEIGRRFGRLDILVNNAAIGDTTAFDDLTLEHYRHVQSINVDGAVIVTMAMVPLMRRSGRGGRILNIA